MSPAPAAAPDGVRAEGADAASDVDRKIDSEREKLRLEMRRLELEERKLDYTREFDEKKLRSERRTKLWTQFSLFTPLMVLLVGFFLNSYLEQKKDEREQFRREQATQEAVKKERREFIERQLTEFYYPLMLRLHKDNAVWKLWNDNQRSKDRREVAVQLERNFLLPNHDDAIKIIDSKFSLIMSDDDAPEDISKLIIEVRKYERHVALYRALRAAGSNENPIDWHEYEDKYPKNLYYILRDRIDALQKRHTELMAAPVIELASQSPQQ